MQDSRKRYVLFSLFTGTGITIFLVILYFIQGGSSERFKVSTKNASGKVLFERNYLDTSSIKLIRTIPFSESIFRIWAFDDQLYVQNWTNINLMRVDTLGRTLSIIGRKGRAPGEFLTITNVSIQNENITVIDHRNLTISEFDKNGLLKKNTTLNIGITEGVKISSNLYIFKTYNADTKDTESFLIFDIDNSHSQTISIPRLQSSQAQKDAFNIELSGFFNNRNRKQIFHVCSFTGQFTAFDSTGKLLYHQYTVDQSPLPNVTIRGSGKEMYVVPASRDINLDADADAEYLYILSNAATPSIKMIAAGTNAQGVIDIYRATDGKYLCSIKIPMQATNDKFLQKTAPLSISVCKNKLYVVQGVSIYSYTFDKSKIAAFSH
jgi:hypothetical protein